MFNNLKLKDMNKAKFITVGQRNELKYKVQNRIAFKQTGFGWAEISESDITSDTFETLLKVNGWTGFIKNKVDHFHTHSGNRNQK